MSSRSSRHLAAKRNDKAQLPLGYRQVGPQDLRENQLDGGTAVRRVTPNAADVAGGTVAAVIAERERLRDTYLMHRDPIAEDRMLWRAQAFRHLVHLLPGQTILELGCGQRLFTYELVRVTRGENPITAVTFVEAADAKENRVVGSLPPSVTPVRTQALPGQLAGQTFDFIVAMDAGSSRVDLQACKLEYSIVSPK